MKDGGFNVQPSKLTGQSRVSGGFVPKLAIRPDLFSQQIPIEIAILGPIDRAKVQTCGFRSWDVVITRENWYDC